MDKQQQQDKIWSELSEESQELLKRAYSNIESFLKGKYLDSEGLKSYMGAFFGKHNLE